MIAFDAEYGPALKILIFALRALFVAGVASAIAVSIWGTGPVSPALLGLGGLTLFVGVILICIDPKGS